MLRFYGRYFHRVNGDAVNSEGLFRGSLTRLKSLPAHSFLVQYKIQTLLDYADLLEELTWNDRSRAEEAKKLREEATELSTEWSQASQELNTFRDIKVEPWWIDLYSY